MMMKLSDFDSSIRLLASLVKNVLCFEFRCAVTV